MKVTAALASLVLLAGTGVVLIQRQNEDRQYRALLVEGEQALAAGEAYKAADSFSRALALRPTSMVAYYRRGEAFGAEGHDEKAQADLREARRLAPDAPAPLEALGRLFDRAGKPALAATWYAQASDRLEDTDAALLYSLALAHYRAGAAAAAREPLRKALSRNPSLSEAHYLLGLVSRDSGNPDDALASLQLAVRLGPTLVSAREELADLYRELGRQEDELVQLRALAAIDEQVYRYLALVSACLRAGQHEDALEAVDRARRLAPNDSRVALASGRVLLARAEAESETDPASVAEALQVLEEALGGTARRSEGLALYGRGLYLSGDVAGSERLLRDAILTSPVNTEAFAFLADAAERLAHPEIARDALLNLDALEGNTASPSVRNARARRIGALALEAQDPQMSVKFLTAARNGAAADAATLGLLARALWEINDLVAARATLADALSLEPEHPDLIRLSRLIR